MTVVAKKDNRDTRPELDALARNITRLRDAKGWSLNDLAKAAGLASSALSGLESGNVKNPRLGTVLAIAQALEVDIHELWEPLEGQ